MIVELLLSGRNVQEVSEEYGLNGSMLRRCCKEYRDERRHFTGKGVASLTHKEKEGKLLKKQLRGSSIEVEILKKAMGIVAKSERKNII